MKRHPVLVGNSSTACPAWGASRNSRGSSRPCWWWRAPQVAGADQVLLVLGAERWPVRRDVGMALLTRSTVLLAEGHIEIAQLPLETAPPAVLHLVLGAQPIVLLEEGARADPGRLLEVPEPQRPAASIAEIFPDVGAHLQDR